MSRSRDTADQINRVDSSAANATAITIDSSENVLVGKTSTGISAAGHSYKADGTWEVRRDLGTANSSSVGYLSRGTTDGSILTFYKDTTAVGSWRSRSGDRSTIILDPRSGGGGLSGGGAGLYPTDNAGTISDGALTLGDPAARFKDLYLSGGVFLGGTGAVNKLDDYEEGSWTPTAASGGSISTLHRAFYIKIGNFVNAYAYINITAPNNTTDLNVGGLPFTSRNLAAYYGGGSGPSYSGSVNTSSWGSPLVLPNTTTIYWHNISSSADVIKNNFNSGNDMALIFNIQYFT